MAFGDKLKEYRAKARISQQKLADLTGVSLRSVQNYEHNKRFPKNISIVKRLAEVLNTNTNELLEEQDYCMIDAMEKGGTRAIRDIKSLTDEVVGLFAGGNLSESDRDAVMLAITNAYWDAKEDNKKFTPKKYRK